MKRFKIIGRRMAWGDFEVESTEYVNAPDADAAVRRAKGLRIQSIQQVREVPWDEGRGPIWRLLQRLKRIN